MISTERRQMGPRMVEMEGTSRLGNGFGRIIDRGRRRLSQVFALGGRLDPTWPGSPVRCLGHMGEGRRF